MQQQLPEWLIKPSPDSGDEIAKFYIDYHLDEKGGIEKFESSGEYATNRAIGEASLLALQDTANLQVGAENAMTGLALKVKQNGWHIFEEYDDIREFFDAKLKDVFERSPTSGARYELQSLLSILDNLEKMGIPKDEVLQIPNNVAKARAATQALNTIIQAEIPEEEKHEQVIQVLREVTSPEISLREFREKVRVARRNEPAEAKIVVLQDKDLLIVSIKKQAVLRTIMNILRNVIEEPSVVDGLQFVKDLTEAIAPRKAGMERYDIVNGLLVRMPGGNIHYPSEETLEREAKIKLAKHAEILSQLANYTGTIQLELFRIDGINEYVENPYLFMLPEEVLIDPATQFEYSYRTEFDNSCMRISMLVYVK